MEAVVTLTLFISCLLLAAVYERRRRSREKAKRAEIDAFMEW
jgi:hypothetical protein